MSEVVRNGSADDGAGRTAKRVWIRALIYVIGLHVFGGFIMLLFLVGNHSGH
jgi:hypothetical protein